MYQADLTASHFQPQDDAPPCEITIGDLMRRQAEARPGQAALKEIGEDGEIGRVWTYSELFSDARRLACALAHRHAKGARIAVYANNLPEWVLLELASGMAGLTLVTVNPAYQARELQFVLEQSRAEAVYFVEHFRGNPMAEIVEMVCAGLPGVKHKILLTDHAALFAGERQSVLPDVWPHDIAQIQYTSGTTGFPKGALLHHFGLIQNGIDAMTRGGLCAGDVLIHCTPLFHTTGCAMLVLGGFGVGASILLTPVFDPVMIARVIESARPRFMLGVPTMIVALINEFKRSGRDPSSIKRIVSGGALVAPELVRKAQAVLGATIQIVYGQTESSPVITQTRETDSLEDLTQTVGQPLPHVEVSIRSLDVNKPVAVGEQGEICTRGYLVMAGYNDNPEATEKAIDSDGWLHTGDLGRMDSRGYVRVTGRVKEMIIRGGENLSPVEIENIMLEHGAVSEVAVIGVPCETYGEQIACFMRAKGDIRPTTAELKSFIRERLSPQKTPLYWIWIEEWPLTGSGKIQKFRLAEQFERGEHTVMKA